MPSVRSRAAYLKSHMFRKFQNVIYICFFLFVVWARTWNLIVSLPVGDLIIITLNLCIINSINKHDLFS